MMVSVTVLLSETKHAVGIESNAHRALSAIPTEPLGNWWADSLRFPR